MPVSEGAIYSSLPAPYNSNLSISAKRKARLSAGFSFGGDGEPALCAGSIRFARFAGREYTIPSRPAPCKSGLRSSDEADRDSNHVRTGRGPVRSPVRTLVNSSMFRTEQYPVSPRPLPCETCKRISPSPPEPAAVSDSRDCCGQFFTCSWKQKENDHIGQAARYGRSSFAALQAASFLLRRPVPAYFWGAKSCSMAYCTCSSKWAIASRTIFLAGKKRS